MKRHRPYSPVHPRQYLHRTVRRLRLERFRLLLFPVLLLPFAFLLPKEACSSRLYRKLLSSASIEQYHHRPQRNKENLYLWLLDGFYMRPDSRLLSGRVVLSPGDEWGSDSSSPFPDLTLLPAPDAQKTDITYSYSGLQPAEQTTRLSELLQMENEAVRNDISLQQTPADSLSSVLSAVRQHYDWKEPAEWKQFIRDYYIIDPSVGNILQEIPAEQLLLKDLALSHRSEAPQILVYHTHGTEDYIDSRSGVPEDTVIGAGDVLCAELEQLGYSVLHDRTTYDFVNGKDNRNYAYSTARPEILKLLAAYPSIEVILDLHRDAGAARTAVINGERTAQIMFFNGLSRNADGPISYLTNENLNTNLAFSLQLNLLGRERFPGFMYRIYLKNYRYNLHLAGRSLLVELGTENNTVREAKNGAKLLASLLGELLSPN